MADGSVPSSGTDPFFQQLPELLPEVVAPKADPFFDGLRKEQMGTLEAQARQSRKFAPEQWSKARALSGNLPIDVALRNLPEVEQNQQMARYRALFEGNDRLRDHYTRNPNDLGLATPDDLDKVDGIDWLFKAGAESFAEGYEDLGTNTLGFKDFLGQATPEDLARIDADEGQTSRTFGAQGWLEKGYVGLAQMLPQMGTVIAAGAGGGASGAAIGGGVGSVVGGAGAAPGAAVGFTIGAYTGSLSANATLMVGDAFNTFKRIKDENGQPIDPNIARVAALAAGASGAMLEQYGLSKTLGQVPGLDRIFRGLGKKEMVEALKNPTVREAFKSFATNLGIGVAAEVSTEVAQEAINIFAGEAAKAAAPGEFDSLSSGEAAERLWETAVQTAQVMTLLGPLGSGARLASDLNTVRQSKVRNDAFQATASQAEGLADFIKRDPVAAAAAIDSQAPDRKVYLPAQELVEYYQTQGKDPYSVDMPGWREVLDESLATGTPVELSIGQFFAHLGKDPKDKPLRDLVRTGPDDYSLEEMKKFSEAYDETVKGVVAKNTDMAMESNSKTIPEPKPSEVELEIKRQLSEAGFTESQADSYAKVQAAIYQTMADRAGRTVEDIYENFGARFQAAEARFEDAPEGAQGVTQFSERPGSNVIKLFENRDLSTVLHETGHMALEAYSALSSTVPGIEADLGAVRQWVGNTGEAFTREQHEKFAKGLEAYYMTGKAPTPELRGAFESFKRWLIFIYRKVQNLGGKVPAEISEVFDRMHATEERLNKVAGDISYTGIFQTAEEMGLPPEEFLAYQKLLDDARAEALDSARASAVGKHVRLMKGWRGQIARQLMTETREKLEATAPYTHFATLKREGFGINRADLTERFGVDAESYFPKGAVRKDGVPVDIVAQVLGYDSADDMLYDFRQAPPLREVVKAEVTQEMKNRFGDDLSDSATLDVAVKRALATDSRKTILGTELKALSAKGGRNISTPTAIRLANEIARKTVYDKPVADVIRLESVYRAGAARAARAADAAVVKGDWDAAATAKRQQLVQSALEQEAVNAVRTIERIRSKAVRYTRTTSKSIDPATMEQIRELVTRFEFAKRSNKLLAQRQQTLQQYLAAVQAEGEVPIIDERLLNEARRVNYKTLSVEELLGFGDALASLEKMGRDRNKLIIEGKKIAHEEVIGEWLENFEGMETKPVRMDSYSTRTNGLREQIARPFVYLLKPERVMNWLGRNDVNSPPVKLFRMIREAGVKERDMMANYGRRMIEVFDSIDTKHLNEMVRVESIAERPDGKGKLMSRAELYAFALNIGNASNLAKLKDGHRWSDAQVADIMSHLDLEDMRRIQKVWDVLGGLWPEIEAMEKRITGVAPKKVEKRSFVFKGETFAGGYYPVVYDRNNPGVMAAMAEEAARSTLDPKMKDLFQPARNMTPGSEHGYTKARVKTKLPISSDLNIIIDHMQTVIHDLTHREAVKSAAKILWDDRIAKAITDVEGEGVYKQLQEWLRNVATPQRHIRDSSPIDKFVARRRANMVIFSFAFRATTGVAQLGGFFNSREQVSGKALRRAGLSYMSNPQKWNEMVERESGLMRHRFNQNDKDLRDNLKKFALKESKLDKVRYWSTLHIAYMDRVVSTITWMGAYDDALNQNPNDLDAAVAVADRAVALSQGTGNVEDMAGIQMDRGIASLFTMFYSAFNAQFNAYVEMTRKTKGIVVDGSWQARTELLTQWMALTILPAVAIAGLTADLPDDDESYLGWMTRKTLLQGVGTVPFAREIGSALDSWYTGKNFGYTATPLNRVGDSFYKAVTEIGQLGSDDADFRAAAKYTATAAGLYLGLPIGGLLGPLDTAWKGLENGDFEWKDLPLGRGDK